MPIRKRTRQRTNNDDDDERKDKYARIVKRQARDIYAFNWVSDFNISEDENLYQVQ